MSLFYDFINLKSNNEQHRLVYHEKAFGQWTVFAKFENFIAFQAALIFAAFLTGKCHFIINIILLIEE